MSAGHGVDQTFHSRLWDVFLCLDDGLAKIWKVCLWRPDLAHLLLRLIIKILGAIQAGTRRGPRHRRDVVQLRTLCRMMAPVSVVQVPLGSLACWCPGARTSRVLVVGCGSLSQQTG